MKKYVFSSSNIIKTVAFVHIRDRRLLLARSKRKKGFYMAGGKHNEGESDQEALIREVKEELQVDLEPESIEFIDVFQAQAYGKRRGVEVRISCYNAKHRGEFKVGEEVVEIRYFSHDEYLNEKYTAPAVRLIVKNLKENGLID